MVQYLFVMGYLVFCPSKINMLCWYPTNNRVGFNIMCYYRACTNNCTAANSNPLKNNATCANPYLVVSLLCLHHFFCSASHCLPASVKRYFCKGLLGFSGMVISSKPLARAGRKYVVRKYFLFFMPNCCCILSRPISFSQANNSRSTGGGEPARSSLLEAAKPDPAQ